MYRVEVIPVQSGSDSCRVEVMHVQSGVIHVQSGGDSCTQWK